MSKLTYQQRGNQDTRIPVGQRRMEGGKALEDNRAAFAAKQLKQDQTAQLTKEEDELLKGKSGTKQLAKKDEEEIGLAKFSGQAPPVQCEEQPAKPNNTGLPDKLKNGIESLSGLSMDNVKVHYNSTKPQQLNALAYAQGTDIHVGPSQEQHLPHEAWHVVQQAQGRVKPTMQMTTGMPVNDDEGLEREADTMGEKAVQMHARMHIAKPAPSSSNTQIVQLLCKLVKSNPETWYDKEDGKYWRMGYSGQYSNQELMDSPEYVLESIKNYNSISKKLISIVSDEYDNFYFKVDNKGGSQPYLIQVTEKLFVSDTPDRRIAYKENEIEGIKPLKLYSEGNFDHSKFLNAQIEQEKTDDFKVEGEKIVPEGFTKANTTIKSTEFLTVPEQPQGLSGSMEIQHGYENHPSVDMTKSRTKSKRKYDLIQSTFPYPGGRNKKYNLDYDPTGFKSLIIEFIEAASGKLSPNGQIRIVISNTGYPTEKFIEQITNGFETLNVAVKYIPKKYSEPFNGSFKHLKTGSKEEVDFGKGDVIIICTFKS